MRSLKLLCDFRLQHILRDSRLFRHCETQFVARQSVVALSRTLMRNQSPVSRANIANMPRSGRSQTGTDQRDSPKSHKSKVPWYFDLFFERLDPALEHRYRRCLLLFQGCRPSLKLLYRQLESFKSRFPRVNLQVTNNVNRYPEKLADSSFDNTGRTWLSSTLT